jgi:hypothetical protein
MGLFIDPFVGITLLHLCHINLNDIVILFKTYSFNETVD